MSNTHHASSWWSRPHGSWTWGIRLSMYGDLGALEAIAWSVFALEAVVGFAVLNEIVLAVLRWRRTQG